MASFGSSPPRRGGAWAQRHVLLVGALVLVVLVAAACVPSASAHERDDGGHAAGHQQHASSPQQGDEVNVVVDEATAPSGDPAANNDSRNDSRDDSRGGAGSAPGQGQTGGRAGQGDDRGGRTGERGTVNVNGLPTLGRDCSQSDLDQHHGFERAPRCVVTEMGEVPAVANSPQLLITGAPERVGAGEPFTLRVSTRNLVRDRFLPAAGGGYYLESSVLNAEGLVRGHFHTACRSLSNGVDAAPDPAVPVDFFQATEDGGGGATPDEVEITVTGGIARRGLAQCVAWAGDGSHRIPMMAGAQQIPAVDTVLLLVQ